MSVQHKYSLLEHISEIVAAWTEITADTLEQSLCEREKLQNTVIG